MFDEVVEFIKIDVKNFAVRVFTSKTVWLVVILHWILVGYGFYMTGSIDVARIDPRTEWYLIAIVLFINFPASIVAVVFTMPFYFLGQSLSQKLLYVFIVIFWTIEWLLIGNVIRALIDGFKHNKHHSLH